MRLFELVVFSFLTGNSDLHLKNIAILYKDYPTLSPAYDLLCMDIWIKDDDQTALSLVGKKNKLTGHDFIRLAQHIGIKEKVAYNVYQRMNKSLPIWNHLINLSFLDNDIKDQYKALILLRLEVLKNS